MKKEKKQKETEYIEFDRTRYDSIRTKYLRWYKLDNSAHLFPVIAGERMTNTYRICVELSEDINPKYLQEALDELLPKFEPFNVRLRKGVFWYYFEENGRRAPLVREESAYPCTFIHSKLNRDYLFSVTYYKNRINLEVFHVLADGMGGLNFLKELVYHYLRRTYPELASSKGRGLTYGTSMNQEDSFMRNYKKKCKPTYETKKAYLIKGEHLRDRQLGVINCKMDVDRLKEVAHKYDMSINEYLVGTYLYSMYIACLHGAISKRALRVAVPVNLRSYYNSVTTKNFFVVISAELVTEKEDYSYEEILKITKDCLKSQLTKEHLEDIFSYNVSNQTNKVLRLFPIWLKNIAMRFVYTRSALANTTTMTNIGNVAIDEAYKPYIENFYAMLAMSRGQFIKATICSYEKGMNVTFSTQFRDTSIAQCFVKTLSSEGIDVTIETNGVYYG